MLRGCETNGYVIVSAAKTSLLVCDHKPVWNKQQLQSKTTLVGSVECMQVRIGVHFTRFKTAININAVTLLLQISV